MGRLTQSLAIAVGTNGAMVDISSYANLREGVTHSYGTQSEFDSVSPRTFSFTLDNGDGRFTPDNTAILATPLTEGMRVCWQTSTRLISGTVTSIAPGFPDAEAAWSTVVVTCDDALGDAARRTLTGSTAQAAAVGGHTPYAYWPFDDVVAPFAQTAGTNQPDLIVGGGTPAYQAPAVSGLAQLQTLFVGAGLVTPTGLSSPSPLNKITYRVGSGGCFGFWITPLADPCAFEFYMGAFAMSPMFRVVLGALSSGIQLIAGPGGGGGATVSSAALVVGVPHYVSVVTTYDPTNTTTANYSATLYVDGVSIGTSTTTSGPAVNNTTLTPTTLKVNPGSTANLRFSSLSHTADRLNEAAVTADITTESGWLTILGQVAPTVQMAALPSGLSTRPIGPVDFEGTALLDAIVDTINTEQGYVYTTTTGTLLAPVERVVVRDRQRPDTVSWTFDATRDLQGAPQFVRDITNMVTSVDMSGPSTSLTVTEASYAALVASANTSETILNNTDIDLIAWGQDRLIRGANRRLRVASLTVDAMTLPTGTAATTTANLLAMIPGDRVRITNLPNPQLSFTTWDGWFIGASETHNLEKHTFELFFQPVLPRTAIYDTDTFMSDGALYLGATIFAAVTTMSIGTNTAGILLETSVFPYDLLMDSEQITVTACTAPSPTFQTVTMTRGVNGTTAATHNPGGYVDTLPALFAF